MASKITFEIWLQRVDRAMESLVGLSHSDIADWQWWDAWDAGQSPASAAREGLEADDTFSAFGGIDF